MSSPLLQEAAWYVDAGVLTADGTALEDLTGQGRHAVFGAGAAAPTVLPYDGEAYLYSPGDTNNAGIASGMHQPTGIIEMHWDGMILDAGSGTQHAVTVFEGWLMYVQGNGTFYLSSPAGYTPANIYGPEPLEYGRRYRLDARHDYATHTMTLHLDGALVGSLVHTGTPTTGGGWSYVGQGVAGRLQQRRYYSASMSHDGVKLCEFLPANHHTDYTRVRNTGTNGGDWTLTRSAAGLKAAIVDRPLLLFGGAQSATAPSAQYGTGPITAIIAVRAHSWEAGATDWLRMIGSGTKGLLIRRTDTYDTMRSYTQPGSVTTEYQYTAAAVGEIVFAGRLDGDDYAVWRNGEKGVRTASVPWGGIGDASTIIGQAACIELIACALWDRALTDAEIARATDDLLQGPTGLIMTIDGINVNRHAVYELSISTGRQDIYGQPDGSILNADILGHIPAGQVGSAVVVRDRHGQLFAGWTTDITSRQNDAMAWRTTITATGPLALLGQTYAGYEAHPVETDSLRVARIIEETPLRDMHAVDTAIEGFDLAPRPAQMPENAADLARLAADSAMGVLWEQPSDPSTPLRYTPGKYRVWGGYSPTWAEMPEDTWDDLDGTWSEAVIADSVAPVLELQPGEVYADLVFEQRIGDVVRTVRVTYGPEDAEQRPQVSAGSGEPPAKAFDTILDSQGDAVQYANTVLQRHSEPLWRLRSAQVEMVGLAVQRVSELRGALAVGAKVILHIPYGSPVGTRWEGYLEGWGFDIVADERRSSFLLTLNVSDRYLTEPADRWSDFDDTTTWDDLLDATTWDDLGNLDEALGRARITKAAEG